MKDFDIPAHIQQADIEQAAAAQSEAEIKNAIKRHRARMAIYTAWVNPKEIELRRQAHEAAAEAALKAAGPPIKLLPVPNPLPDYMKGQAPSTIQAMLRSGWKPEPKE